MIRAVLVAVGLVVFANTAHAAKVPVVIVTGDDIEHIRDLDSEKAALYGYHKLGYHYDRFGVFWLDVWRSDGEFVVYEGDTYAQLTDADLAELGGASVPWRYHLPEGLIIILGLVELAVVGRRKRKAKLVLVVGGILLLVSGAFVLMGLTWEFMIPLLLGLHHLLTAYSAMKAMRDEEALAASNPALRASQQTLHADSSGGRVSQSGSHRVSQSNISQSGSHRASRSGSHRLARPAGEIPTSAQNRAAITESGQHDMVPSRPSQPIVVQRPTTEPVAPIRRDDSVDGPKLLR